MSDKSSFKKVLFISYDGLTDPLGQSQILPYLIGLSNLGHSIHILSCEKKENFELNFNQVNEKIMNSQLSWTYTFYSNRPPIISTVFIIQKMKSLALKIAQKQQTEIIHCRSLIPAMIGSSIKKKQGGKLVFDIRGFWADERIEGGIWNYNNPLFRFIYNFFKSKEKHLFENSDYIISLTENAKNFIAANFKTKGNFQVIPCSVDLNHFNSNQLDDKLIASLKLKFNFLPSDFVLTYVGSLGTRYLLKEMLLFFKSLKQQKKEAKFLFITKSNTKEIESICKEHAIDFSSVIITSCDYNEIPNYIAVGNASIFFIVTSFTGKAVSPTKQSEVMSLGLPIVSNSGLGDTDKILEATNTGIVVKEFNKAAYEVAAKKLLQFNRSKNEIREVAVQYFSLDAAIEKYREVYAQL